MPAATKTQTTAAAPKKAAAAPAPAPVAAPVTEAPVEAVKVKATVEKAVVDLTSQIAGLEKELRTLKAALKKVVSVAAREVRDAQLSAKKRKRASNTTTGGIIRPVKISADLAKFLGVPAETLMPRVEVMKRLIAYIKQNNLSDPNNRRVFYPDASLCKLLGTKEGNGIDYFSKNGLNSLLKQCNHFPKN